MKEWKCRLCGYVHKGNNPPKECPQCSSSSSEFRDVSKIKKFGYKGEKIDIMLINGSSHSAHNTMILADLAESELRKKGVSYRRVNLNELDINHCWCCYSMYDRSCTYPCRNQLDEMPKLHEMLLNSKAVIVCSPINWNNIPARLKDFLDRLTCIQNMYLLGQENRTTGKAFGVLINGHEDGAVKTSMDIFLYFQQMGYIFAPFSFAYKTHGAGNDTRTDHDYFKSNEKLAKEVRGIVNNVVELVKLDMEKKLKGKIIQVCE
jgi:multimeric flavodoxin WrbA